MMTLILATFLTATPAPQTAQFRPCVWPNRCASSETVAAGPVTTCVWPNICG